MRKLAIWGERVDRSRIDDAVSHREVDFLANLICTENVEPEVKEHLAHVVFNLLTGKRKFPRRRPKNKLLEWDNEHIGKRVWLTKRDQRLKKITSAAEQVARDLNISPRKVWECWKSFDVGKFEYRQEKAEHDFLMHMAAETRWEAAIESLKEEHGDREFTDEEIEDEAKELDLALQDCNPDYGY